MVFLILIISLGACLLTHRLRQDRIIILELKTKVENYEKEKNREAKRNASKNSGHPATGSTD